VQILHHVPLLSRLPRVELAKLVSDVETVEVTRGDAVPVEVEQRSYVYIVHRGKIGVYVQSGDTNVWLMSLGVGEVVGEPNEVGVEAAELVYQASEDSLLLRLEAWRFQGILSRHPDLLRAYSETLIRRSMSIMDELVRTKKALVLHAQEIWQAMDSEPTAVDDVAVTADAGVLLPAEPAPVAAGPVKKARLSVSWRQAVPYAGPVLVALATYTVGFTQWSYSGLRASLAAMVWGVFAWLTDALPDYVVAMTITLAVALVGIVTPEVAFSGFSSKTWFLLLAVLGISAGISRTGLLYRIALHMLKIFPSTYTGQSAALALGGLVLAPFLPGVTGRQAMASRLSLELSEAMRFPHRSRESAGLAMACFLGFSCIYYISLTGGSVTLLIWSVIPEATKAGLSWGKWFIAALPASLFVFGSTLYAILRLHRPQSPLSVTRDIVDSQLRVLGPMSRQEWFTVWVVLAIVGAFITQPLHGVDPTWVALPGFLFLAAAGIVDRDLIRKGIDWGFLLLTGGLLGIAALTEKSGLVKVMSQALAPAVQPIAGHPWLFLTAIALITSVIHLAVPFQPTILLVALALVPVSANLGYNPFIVGLVILIMASHFIVPHGNPMYMAAYGGSEERAFKHNQVRAVALIHATLTLVGVWISIPIWSGLGLVFLHH